MQADAAIAFTDTNDNVSHTVGTVSCGTSTPLFVWNFITTLQSHFNYFRKFKSSSKEDIIYNKIHYI